MITFEVDADLVVNPTDEGATMTSARLGESWFTGAATVPVTERLRRPVEWRRLSDDERAVTRKLVAAGVVTVSCRDKDGVIATALACTSLAHFQPEALPGAEPIQLSPWALGRRTGSHYTIESAVDGTVIRLLRPQAAAVLARLAEPATVTGTDEFAALLVMFGLAGPPSTDDHRHPHEVWTHTLTRTGMAARPRPPSADPGTAPADPPCDIPFTAPDAEKIGRTDPPLIEVMEARRSRRDFATEPVTVDQLNELLYRVARTQRQVTDGPYPMSMRPAPSAGALHELGIYPVVRSCAGLRPGIYRYNPVEHGLATVNSALAPTVRIIDAAFTSLGRISLPPIVLTFAADFERPHRKYGSLSYSLTLKNVGVLVQSIYLAAQAMGLAVCALGSGDSAAFADATGLDPLKVSTVGEVAIGRQDSGPDA